jgi:hypothetical protein
MKIRNGFVSNSSSSSFILLGVKMTKNTLLNNEQYISQFDQIMKEYEQHFIDQWDKKINHPDYTKHKNLYEMCKSNKVSIPNETRNFFGYNFNGVFEPFKPNGNDVFNEMIMEEKFKFSKGISTLTDNSIIYVGKVFTDSEEIDSGTLSLDDIKKYTDELVNVGFDLKDIKIHYGTRAC